VKIAAIQPEIKLFIDQATANVPSAKSSILFCTYTAMLQIRKELKNMSMDMGEGL
jgi:hypothetical protein